MVRQKDGKTKTVNVKPKKIKDKKGNPLTRMISENSKSFDELKTETLAILQEFKKIKDEKSASHILENDITEEEQLALTIELSFFNLATAT